MMQLLSVVVYILSVPSKREEDAWTEITSGIESKR